MLLRLHWHLYVHCFDETVGKYGIIKYKKPFQIRIMFWNGFFVFTNVINREHIIAGGTRYAIIGLLAIKLKILNNFYSLRLVHSNFHLDKCQKTMYNKYERFLTFI